MYKIINNRRYDTRSAKQLATWDNGLYNSDLDFVVEELYIKKTGEYFLYGRGGARTAYGKRTGSDSWGGGEGLRPLTAEEALQWAKEHLGETTCETLFEGVYEVEPDSEGEPLKRLNVFLPESIMDKINAKKEATGISCTRQLLDALRNAGY